MYSSNLYRQRTVSQKTQAVADTSITSTGNGSPPDAQGTDSTPEYAVLTEDQMTHNHQYAILTM